MSDDLVRRPCLCAAGVFNHFDILIWKRVRIARLRARYIASPLFFSAASALLRPTMHNSIWLPNLKILKCNLAGISFLSLFSDSFVPGNLLVF